MRTLLCCYKSTYRNIISACLLENSYLCHRMLCQPRTNRRVHFVIVIPFVMTSHVFRYIFAWCTSFVQKNCMFCNLLLNPNTYPAFHHNLLCLRFTMIVTTEVHHDAMKMHPSLNGLHIWKAE